MDSIQEKIKSSALYYNKIIATALLFIAAGTVFYHIVEDLSWIDSLYFTVITLATVGYGDITPQTSAGKLFTIFYVIVGITIFVALAHAVLAKVINRRTNKPNK